MKATLRLLTLCFFFSFAFTNGPLRAQTAGTLDAGYDPQVAGSNGFVLATAVQPDGKTVIVGQFTSVLGVPRSNVARLNANGSLDMGFDPKANNNVYGVAVQSDGKILLIGLFTTLQPNGAASATARQYIARVQADGSLDAGFDPKPNNYVRCVAVQADGRIIFGGDFTTLTPNGGATTTQNRIARVNANGSLDMGFDPRPNVHVDTVAVQVDGKILLGGYFTTLQPNGAAPAVARQYVARVNADGTLDLGFDPKADSYVISIAVQVDGRILLGGIFTTLQPNGAATATTRRQIARLQLDGSLDMGFDPKANNYVNSIVLQADGRILLGGDFTTLQPNGAATATARPYLARVQADGSLDMAFDPEPNNSLRGVAVQADGKILLGGYFTTLRPNGAATATARNFIARLNNDAAPQSLTAPDATQAQWQRSGSSPEISQVTLEQSTDGGGTWTLLGNGARVGNTANWQFTGLTLPASGLLRTRGRTNGGFNNSGSGIIEQVEDFGPAGSLALSYDPDVTGGDSSPLPLNGLYAMAVQVDGKTVIGGNFGMVGGGVHPNLARLNADGTADASFTAGTDNTVNCVAVQADRKLVIGGQFASVNNTAGIDAIARLNVDGTLDAGFHASADSVGGVNASAGIINGVIVLPDGKLVIAGAFDTVNGMAGINNIARLEANGTLDTDFNAGGSGPDGTISCVAMQADGKLVLSGDFMHMNGAAVGHGLARLNADGTLDTGFNALGTPGFIYSVVVQADGKIVVGGAFAVGNGTPGIHNIMRLNAGGTTDESFTTYTNSAVRSIALQADGRILLGGNFTSVNDTAVSYNIARFDAGGTLDPGFSTGTGTDGGIRGIVLQKDGKVLLGGTVTNVNGIARNGIARLNNDSAMESLNAPDATRVQWQRRGTAPEVSLVTFELSSDGGGTWALLGNGTRVAATADWQLTGLALPAGGQLRVRGRNSGGFLNGSSGPVETIALFPSVSQPPIFTTPAMGTTTPGPVAVSFSLTTAAWQGSVTLTFDDGVTPRILVLTGLEETQDTHSFSFDPAQPTAATAVIASGEAIPDGTYTVTLSYQDTLGNSLASNTHTNVTIDTTPPTITAPPGGFTPLVVYEGTLPDYRNQPTTGDNVGVTNVTQSPMQGSATTPGDLLVTLTAHDAAGHTADISFYVTVRPADPVSTTQFAPGDPAPGAGTNGLPADALLASFGVPATDDAGDLAFLAKWTSTTGGKGSGLFINSSCLGIVGGDAPITGAKYKSFTDPVTDNGHVACIAALTGTPKPPAAVVLSNAANGGTLEVIAQVGGTATADGAQFKSFKAVAISNSYAAVFAQLAAGTGTTPKTTPANDLGLWIKDGTDPLTLALREGQTVAGKVIKTLVSFAPGAGSPGQGRGWLSSQPAIGGKVLALALFTDKSQGIVAVDASDIAHPIVLSLTGHAGDGSPDLTGATFASYSLPILSDFQASAFLASLAVGQGGVTKTNAHGIFSKPALTGDYAALVRLGDAAVSGAKFSVLKDPVLARDSGIAFPATIKGGTVKGLAAMTLWWQPPGGTLGLLAQGGAATVGDLPGAQWKAFTSLAIAAYRGPIFAATLVPGKGGVTAKNATGVWATDFTNAPRLLFRAGDVLGGKTVKSFALLKASVGSTGVTRSFNNAAQVVWLATFTDKTQAIIVTEVP